MQNHRKEGLHEEIRCTSICVAHKKTGSVSALPAINKMDPTAIPNRNY